MSEWYERMPDDWKKRYPIAANGGDIARDYRNIQNKSFRFAMLLVFSMFAALGVLFGVIATVSR